MKKIGRRDKNGMRGYDLLDWGAYLENGGSVYPLDMFGLHKKNQEPDQSASLTLNDFTGNKGVAEDSSADVEIEKKDDAGSFTDGVSQTLLFNQNLKPTLDNKVVQNLLVFSFGPLILSYWNYVPNV